MIGKILRTRGNALSGPTYWEVVRKKVEAKRSDRDEIWELNSCSTPRCIRYRSTTELNKWYTEVEPMVQQEKKQEKECGLFQEPAPKCTTYRFSASSPAAIDLLRIKDESLTADEPVAIVWESGKFQIVVHESIWKKAEHHKEAMAYTNFLYEFATNSWFKPKPGLLNFILKRIKEIKYGPYEDTRKVNVKVNVVRI
jgi:hypothetical protein